MPRGGKRDNSGRKPIWDVEQIRAAIKEHTATWWAEIGRMMTSKDKGERKFALSEFNKLQVKALPQQLTGEDGGPMNVAITGINYIVPNGDNANPRTQAAPGEPGPSGPAN